ncbi:MAG: Mth938-like domain-containing protein [Spirochaetota bacterium]
MMIEAYSFGKMRVGSADYMNDLIVFPDRVIDNWRRDKGHSLSLHDIRDVLDYKPDYLVIGTGAFGVLKVPARTAKEIEALGIHLVSQRSARAVTTFNTLVAEGKRVAGGFHLTC